MLNHNTAATTNVLTTANMLWSVHYYNYFGRSLESYAQHYLAGNLTVNNYDAISSTYNFTNEPTTVTRKHWTYNSTANPLVIVYNRYTYDQTERKLNTYEQLTNSGSAADTLRIISDLYYNEIGQLRFKKLQGYGPAVLDRSSTNRLAIRGREQQLIDYFGRAISDNGRSGNVIRGVAKGNILGRIYHNASTLRFGELYRYTGL